MLCVCITLTKTIYNPTNGTNAAHLLSTPATAHLPRPEFWPDKEIWPPRARVYEGIAITADDIYTAINLFENNEFPTCTGASCAAFHMVTRVDEPLNSTTEVQANRVSGSSHSPKPWFWPLQEIWPPRAQVYEGICISEDDIYRAINCVENKEFPICKGASCAAFTLVARLNAPPESIPVKPEFWPLDEIWPPRARIQNELNITADDIYRAINLFRRRVVGPMCTGPDANSIRCAALDLVEHEAYKPEWLTLNQIWRLREVYQGLKITKDDIYRAINVYENDEWPICRGKSCETINCATVSCAAFNLVFDINLPPEWWDLARNSWPPRARHYGGYIISTDDIYRAINAYEKDFDEWPICGYVNLNKNCTAFSLVIESASTAIEVPPKPSFWRDEIWPPTHENTKDSTSQ